MNRPTAHRILRVLVEEGAVEQDPSTRRYLIGGEVSLLGLARSTRFPLRGIAEPHLRHLADVLGDTAFLTVRIGPDSVCIDRHPGSFPVKVLSIEIGARRPLGVGVSGLVLLASLAEDEFEAIVRRNARRLRALGVDPGKLVEQTSLARERGYAYAPIGVVPGSRAVAVPVRLADGPHRGRPGDCHDHRTPPRRAGADRRRAHAGARGADRRAGGPSWRGARPGDREPPSPARLGNSLQRRVITISRYSPGTTIVPSSDRLRRLISACMSLSSAACPAGCSAAKALSTGP